MTARRDHISLKTKLASALLALGHIPYEDSKLMTADQVISLFVFDHGILHAISPINEPYNLTPRLIAEHREKTRRDIAIVAKVKRLERKYSVLPAPGTNAYLPSKQKLKPKRKWPSRKIPSRPFQTQTKRPR